MSAIAEEICEAVQDFSFELERLHLAYEEYRNLLSGSGDSCFDQGMLIDILNTQLGSAISKLQKTAYLHSEKSCQK